MSYQDKNLTCSDCFHSFAFSATDQQLFGELGYDRPGRCRSCWKAREVRRRGAGGPATLISPPEFRSPSAVMAARGRSVRDWSIQMGFLNRVFRRRGQVARRRASSEPVQTEAEEKAARKYWKGEVNADRERRGTPDKHRK